ncbi:sulfotransferase domain-containing protein [Salipiger mucosus]|uniref:sulfotransferase domain-containing protein n=1 Tax=Salipiger mucosus TaxID=263378 RepID=UPI000A0572DC|nr:sulfotransferase domain-containing protein [Salipiger mucosus]
MAFMKSAPVRKSRAIFSRIPRLIARTSASDDDYLHHPPVIVNSLPKSGTHLLMQLAMNLPGTRQYGSFIAQTPSLTLKLRSQQAIDRRIKSVAPGEVVGAHLHYSPETAEALRRRNALHLFIWRDPRDVLLSEAHYLAKMNRWHAMHKTFASLSDFDAQVRLAITGLDEHRYPRADKRIGPYMGWTESYGCVCLRYEDLVSPQTNIQECQRIIDAYKQLARSPRSLPSAKELVNAIDPQGSHTFNKGGIARWKEEMSPANLDLCHAILGKWTDPE